MANNIIVGNQPYRAKGNHSFVSMGFTPLNVNRITLIDPFYFKSFIPESDINSLTGTEDGKWYIISAKLAMDRTEYFEPPFSTGNGILLEDGSGILVE